MKLLTFYQQPNELQPPANWHTWRRQGIGSSDASVVMGVSPWKTRFQLWQEKTGKISDITPKTWPMQRGLRLEPVVRGIYENAYNILMPQLYAVSEMHDFIRASLDGFNHQRAVGIEIKCPGAQDHQTALRGLVPEKYVYQLQHQHMTVKMEYIDYVSYNGTVIQVVRTPPNQELMEKLFEEEFKFWQLVIRDIPPELTQKEKRNTVQRKKTQKDWFFQVRKMRV